MTLKSHPNFNQIQKKIQFSLDSAYRYTKVAYSGEWDSLERYSSIRNAKRQLSDAKKYASKAGLLKKIEVELKALPIAIKLFFID